MKMRTFAIINPENETVGNIYFYNREYYHNSPTGVHGPWKTEGTALTEWADIYEKDLQYFSVGAGSEGISNHIISDIRSQKERVTAFFGRSGE